MTVIADDADDEDKVADDSVDDDDDVDDDELIISCYHANALSVPSRFRFMRHPKGPPWAPLDPPGPLLVPLGVPTPP